MSNYDYSYDWHTFDESVRHIKLCTSYMLLSILQTLKYRKGHDLCYAQMLFSARKTIILFYCGTVSATTPVAFSDVEWSCTFTHF